MKKLSYWKLFSFGTNFSFSWPARMNELKKFYFVIVPFGRASSLVNLFCYSFLLGKGKNNHISAAYRYSSVKRQVILILNTFIEIRGNKNHFGLENNLHTATFAPRSRAAVARWAHNPKVGSSNLPFATKPIRQIVDFLL
jgi:hypothetical protein